MEIIIIGIVILVFIMLWVLHFYHQIT